MEETKKLLAENQLTPKASLGQSFCIDIRLLRRLVDYSSIKASDTVLEIGAGFGSLTILLAESAGTVLAVELDPILTKLLRHRVADRGNVRVIEGDILRQSHLVFQKVVANPPYSISLPLLLTLLRWEFTSAVLTLQREFAEKLTAKQGEEQYSQLSVLVSYRTDVELLERVPRSAFYPRPKVESAVVRVRQRPPAFHIQDEEVFFRLVKTLFTQRNRMVRHGLVTFLRQDAGASKEEARRLLSGFPHLDHRVEELAPRDFADITNPAVSLVKGTKLTFEGLSLYIFPEVYRPSDDTFLLAKHLDVSAGEDVLDMGTGCGLLGILSAKRGAKVMAVDISPYAVSCAELNAKLNGVASRIDAEQSDLFQKVSGKFELVIFNPPYLPMDQNDRTKGWLEKAWQGGKSGREVIERFVKVLPSYLKPNGRMLMVLSSLTDPEKVVHALESQRLDVAILEEESFEFERLIVLRASCIRNQV